MQPIRKERCFCDELYMCRDCLASKLKATEELLAKALDQVVFLKSRLEEATLASRGVHNADFNEAFAKWEAQR